MTDVKTDVQISKFSYRIEPKSEGGFAATPSEPGMPVIDGATREEVQQKIQAAIRDMIGKQLPAIFRLGNLSLRLNSNINFTTRSSSSAPAPSDRPITPDSQGTLPMNAPIIPERSSGTVLWVIVGLLILGALMYFSYLHK